MTTSKICKKCKCVFNTCSSRINICIDCMILERKKPKVSKPKVSKSSTNTKNTNLYYKNNICRDCKSVIYNNKTIKFTTGKIFCKKCDIKRNKPLCSICKVNRCSRKNHTICSECREIESIKKLNPMIKCNNCNRVYYKHSRCNVEDYCHDCILENMDYDNRQIWFYYPSEKTRNKLYHNSLVNLRYKNNPIHKLKQTIRSRINIAIKSNYKSGSSTKLLGCTIKYYREYISGLFLDGMTWENHGKWQLDHIIPCNYFDLSDPVQQRRCFNYKNTRPIWTGDNQRKSAKLPDNLKDLLEKLENIG